MNHGSNDCMSPRSRTHEPNTWNLTSTRIRIALSVLTLAMASMTWAAGAAGVASIVHSNCSATDNKLRYDCTFDTDIATAVTVEWDDGTTVRSTAPSPIGLTHRFRLVGMRAGVRVNWRAWTSPMAAVAVSATTGSFWTSHLKVHEWATLTILPAMGGHSVQSVLFPADCGGSIRPDNQMLFIADTGGEVVWYQDPSAETGGGQVGALNLTERRTILAIHNGDIVEYTLEGELVTHLRRNVDFFDTVHHDVFRRGNRLFALSSVETVISDGSEQQYDGVLVFDGSGLTDSWDSSNLYIPERFSGTYDPSTDCYSSNDCTHTNALWVGRDDTWTMSQRTPGRIIQIDGDPSSTTYGQVLWELDGQSAHGDFTIVSSLTSDTTFEGQHNVQFLPNGELLMFDNEFEPYTGPLGGTGIARALQIRLIGSFAAITQEYLTGLTGHLCSSRGSAFKIDGPNGKILTTCTDDNKIQEINSAGVTLWKAQTSCGAATLTGLPYRTIPIELP
ncbi:aryl-sulfate sulfotransferase [Myxococcota bacterium]|nr:aryl-sulfate sulfotransferase [Myxococcota bacterium]